jgi:hypothetical protein
MAAEGRTRREALAGAGALSLAASAAATGWDAAGALGAGAGERSGLAAAIDAEQTAAAAYGFAVEGGLLAGPLAGAATKFRARSAADAAAFAAELRRLGGERPRPPRAPDIDGIAAVRSAEDFVALAIGLENAAVRRCLALVQGTGPPRRLRRAVRIMADHGRRLVVLRQALGGDPAEWVPDAFETGTSPPPA